MKKLILPILSILFLLSEIPIQAQVLNPPPEKSEYRYRHALSAPTSSGPVSLDNTNVATIPADIQTFITDALNGIPLATDLRVSKWDIATGAELRSGELENFIDAKVNFNGAITTNVNYVTRLTLQAGIQNGPGSSIIDRGDFRGGYGLGWINAEIGANAGVVLNWTADRMAPKTGPQAVFGAYTTTRALNGIWPYLKVDFLLNQSRPLGRSPALLFGAGVKLPF